MSRIDQAFDILRESNPLDAESVELELTGTEMLEMVRRERVRLQADRPVVRRGAILAIAAAVILLLALVPVVVARLASENPAPASTIPPAPSEAPASLSDFIDQVLPVGRYRSDAVGVEFSMDLTSRWYASVHDPGHVVVDQTRNTNTLRPYLALIRATALADYDTSRETVGRGWPVDDLDGWIARYGSEIGASELRDITVGGLPARTFTIRLPDDVDCVAFTPCLPFLTNRGVSEIGLDFSREHEVWWIDIEDAPLVIVAMDVTIDDTTHDVIDSLEFGDPRPHPVPAEMAWQEGFDAVVPAGGVSVPALGGVRFELSDETLIRRRENLVWLQPEPGEIVIFDPLSTMTGGPVDNVDAAIAALLAADATVVEESSTTVAGFPARVFDVSDGPLAGSDSGVFIINRRNNEIGEAWAPPTTARVLVLDTPDGPVVIAYGIFNEDTIPSHLTPIAEMLIATLEFEGR